MLKFGHPHQTRVGNRYRNVSITPNQLLNSESFFLDGKVNLQYARLNQLKHLLDTAVFPGEQMACFGQNPFAGIKRWKHLLPLLNHPLMVLRISD
jgi:hypothetical protein